MKSTRFCLIIIWVMRPHCLDSYSGCRLFGVLLYQSLEIESTKENNQLMKSIRSCLVRALTLWIYTLAAGYLRYHHRRETESTKENNQLMIKEVYQILSWQRPHCSYTEISMVVVGSNKHKIFTEGPRVRASPASLRCVLEQDTLILA